MKRIRLHNRTANGPNANSMAPPQWLTIFNDLITLLMVFFVLLFSLGSMNFQRFQRFQSSLQSAMGVMNGGRSNETGMISETPDAKPAVLTADQPDINANERSGAAKEVENLNRLTTADGLEAEITNRGIQLVLDDRLLFSSGSAQLSAEGLQLLEKVGSVIKPFNRFIRVEGHTDDVPIETRRYPSNWELSAARAINVVRFFINEAGFSPAILSAAGYGSSRPRAGNDSAEDRAKNRRVEIILAQPIPSPANQAQPDNGGN
jgi:chemotaxis protein MotB